MFEDLILAGLLLESASVRRVALLNASSCSSSETWEFSQEIGSSKEMEQPTILALRIAAIRDTRWPPHCSDNDLGTSSYATYDFIIHMEKQAYVSHEKFIRRW